MTYREHCWFEELTFKSLNATFSSDPIPLEPVFPQIFPCSSSIAFCRPITAPCKSIVGPPLAPPMLGCGFEAVGLFLQTQLMQSQDQTRYCNHAIACANCHVWCDFSLLQRSWNPSDHHHCAAAQHTNGSMTVSVGIQRSGLGMFHLAQHPRKGLDGRLRHHFPTPHLPSIALRA